MIFILISNILIIKLILLFFLLSKKQKWDLLLFSTFECGFTSYFFSRFSFSIHYFIIGLIFLFLDLELCFLFPFFNEDFSSLISMNFMWIFIFTLLLGLLMEWKEGELDWKF